MTLVCTIKSATLASAMSIGFGLLGAGSASAGTVTFDFGLIGGANPANPSAMPCAGKCILPGAEEQYFVKSGVTVGAIGYNAKNAIAYVTQKPGAIDPTGGETGLGESDNPTHPSDSDYEVTTKTWLLIDNAAAFAAGYQSGTFSIESIQSGEGAKVWGYTGSLTTLDPIAANLTLLGTLSNPATGGVTQTIDVPIDSKYLLVQAFEPPHGSSAADIVVSQEVLNTSPVGGVPEPSTWALMGLGFAGLAFAGYRRAKGAAALA